MSADRYVPSPKKLSGGGMSEAKIFSDQHLEREVVIKKLSPGTDPGRILDELAALQAIRSKHVVQIYDVIRQADGSVEAIVEEYLPGSDLRSLAVPSNSEELLSAIFPIAEGIADIHRHGIIHRDIKRENMKYDAEKCLKIFDFGLARDSDQKASTIGATGTPGYMAPELFIADKDGKTSFTQAVDTFAFGTTVLAIAKGSLPADLEKMPPTLPCKDADFSTLPQKIPAEISKLLSMCLDQDPNKRPTMDTVSRLIGLHLLRGRHSALLISRGKTYVLNKDNPVVDLNVSGQGQLKITYDGLRFVISQVKGDVAINNIPASNGDFLPGSCVIVLGAASLRSQRTMITVDVSHPEVAL